MNATLNNVPRKKLSDELDRMDQMLDGLSEAIPAVVAESIRVSVRQAVRETLHEVIAEVLANQDLLRLLEATRPVEATAKPTVSVGEPPSAAPPATIAVWGPPTSPPSPEPSPPSLVSRVCRTVWQGACAATRVVGQTMARVGRALWHTVKTPARWAARGIATIATVVSLACAARRWFAPI